jgi:hypothetical protein
MGVANHHHTKVKGMRHAPLADVHGALHVGCNRMNRSDKQHENTSPDPGSWSWSRRLGAGDAIAAHAQQSALDALLNERLREHNSGWGDSFDSTAQGQAPVISPEPMFSPASAVNLETALRQHSDMMNRGGWTQVPADATLRLGVRHPNVQAASASDHRR